MRQIIDRTTGEVKEYTEEGYIAERDRLIMAWQASQTKLAAAKESEMQLRKELVEFAFDQSKQSGTETLELGGGYKLKAGKKLNYGFIKGEDGKTDRKAIETALTKIEKDGAVGELIAERLVKWSPELSISEYKKLDEKYRKAIDAVIVTSEGAPTLEFIEPAAAK